jgi:SHOCT-like domain
MATTEERMQILRMVAEKKITAEEGARLLSALEPEKKKEQRVVMVSAPASPRWFRIRVTDLETGKSKVNVNLPMSLVNVGIKMGARFAPEVEGVDFDEIVEQIKSGAEGKIIDVEDVEDGERVEIYVE